MRSNSFWNMFFDNNPRHDTPQQTIISTVLPVTWFIILERDTIKYHLAIDAGLIEDPEKTDRDMIYFYTTEKDTWIEIENLCVGHKKAINKEFMQRYGPS